jgi:hypothetical protein
VVEYLESAGFAVTEAVIGVLDEFLRAQGYTTALAEDGLAGSRRSSPFAP